MKNHVMTHTGNNNNLLILSIDEFKMIRSESQILSDIEGRLESQDFFFIFFRILLRLLKITIVPSN